MDRILRLGRHEFGEDHLLIMAIVNRTPDSFYDKGATWDEQAAYDRVHQVVADGAEIVDIGGVKAAPGAEVGVTEEIRRVVDFVAAVRAEYPDLVISVDTWRSEVAREACRAGADLLNDSWGGHDPKVADVAAEFGAAIVCTHANGQKPRTRPHRTHYADVVADVIETTTGLAERAVKAGVDPARILIDPTHDFAKNAWHSLELTRRLGELTDTGWPVLVSVSNKNFIGDTLGLPVAERVAGSLAQAAICAWLGARVFRVHQVVETRQVLDMVASIKGLRAPARVARGLA
jgi:dihydropteroate synthase